MQEDQDPDKPDKPPAMAEASPTTAESSSGESLPVDRKDVSNNGNKSNDLGEYITSPLQTLLLLTR